MTENEPTLPLDIYLGQVELCLTEALKLRPGMVLEFDLSQALKVNLMVGGATWCSGILRLGDDGAFITLDSTCIEANSTSQETFSSNVRI